MWVMVVRFVVRPAKKYTAIFNTSDHNCNLCIPNLFGCGKQRKIRKNN